MQPPNSPQYRAAAPRERGSMEAGGFADTESRWPERPRQQRPQETVQSAAVTLLQRTCESWGRFCLSLSSQERTGLAALGIFTVLVLLQTVKASVRVSPVQFDVRTLKKGRAHSSSAPPSGVAQPTSPPEEALGNAYSLLLVGDTGREGGSRIGRGDEWRSALLRGTLSRSPSGVWAVRWEEPQPLRGGFSHQGRGMELSCLQFWRPSDQLFTCDDRTGIVFELQLSSLQLFPRWILAGGDGNTERPFKCEWMATKDGRLYVGSVGKEWVEGGKEVHNDFQWVKIVTGERDGRARSALWEPVYDFIRKTLHAEPPGYVVHEAVQWSTHHQRWYFLPLLVSTVRWDESDQRQRTSQVLVSCDAAFAECTTTEIGGGSSAGPALERGRGFVEFKFVPGTGDHEIAAVRVDDSPEPTSEAKSYMTVFNLHGKVLMADQLIPGDQKYEGLEILPRG